MLQNQQNRKSTHVSYRYGFQAQERDDEIKGAGNSVNYTYRMHDTRLGRFFAVDPLVKCYPHYTPYSFSGNKVIAFIELEGLEEIYYGGVFAEYGYSNSDRIANETTTMKNAVKEFQSAMNQGYNALIVDGLPITYMGRRPKGETVLILNSKLTSFSQLKSDEERANSKLAEFLKTYSIDYNDPVLLDAINETLESGRDLILIIMNNGFEKIAHGLVEGKFGFEINEAKEEAAFNIIHEFVAHALPMSKGQQLSEEEDHREFFGGRNENGSLKDGATGGSYSPGLNQIDKSSIAGKALKEIKSILKDENNE